MNFSRQVSRNISLKRAGLGFIADAQEARIGSVLDTDSDGRVIAARWVI